jgi:hypothetical protein
MAQYNFNKSVNPDKLKIELATAGLASTLTYINTVVGVSCELHFSSELSSGDQASLSALIDAHVPVTTAEGLATYLSSTIYPFVSKLIAAFASENIAMGITQSGKSDDVLGLFTKKYAVGNENFPVSLKDSLDTGSLYVALQILAHIRANEDVSSLSPFVTDARIVILMNKIEAQLGMSLTT